MKIVANDAEKNAIKICSVGEISVVAPGNATKSSIGDRISFHAYETHPSYFLKLIH